ncbi:hypothetical protein ANANG_G00234730 [Anguilla anguilla]|uniref:Transferrin-like domain-containing protein n=1 Tax=Anguilla anguilla TaxID=7936 RepID=A0A9D3RNH4_ANGAN|nr:hypothetical protein ANANG_G00234730 [Anguilla anguilla]
MESFGENHGTEGPSLLVPLQLYRCWTGGAGEGAFVKRTTAPESAGYQLLCNNGSRGDASSLAACHLARVPAHAVVSRTDAQLEQPPEGQGMVLMPPRLAHNRL